MEAALYRKATGAYIPQQESYKCKHIRYDAAGKKTAEDETVEVCEVQKYYPPEMAAIALWLKTRCPEIWGDAPAAVPAAQIVDDVREDRA